MGSRPTVVLPLGRLIIDTTAGALSSPPVASRREDRMGTPPTFLGPSERVGPEVLVRPAEGGPPHTPSPRVERLILLSPPAGPEADGRM